MLKKSERDETVTIPRAVAEELLLLADEVSFYGREAVAVDQDWSAEAGELRAALREEA